MLIFAVALAVGGLAYGFTFWPISVLAIYHRTGQWIGLDMKSVESRLKGRAMTRGTWQHGSFSGKTVSVAYDRYSLELSFGSDERVIFAIVTITKTI